MFGDNKGSLCYQILVFSGNLFIPMYYKDDIGYSLCP